MCVDPPSSDLPSPLPIPSVLNAELMPASQYFYRYHSGLLKSNRSCRIFNKPSRSYYKQHFSSKCEYSPQLWFVVFGSSHFIASTDIFNRDHQSRLVVRKASYLFWFYLWLVGVDPTIQITREMIGDEQLSITAGSCFKCMADFIFLLQWRRFISGFLQPRSLLTSMLHMKF